MVSNDKSESEAEESWCPRKPGDFNDLECRCMGSLCMAWRWSYLMHPDKGHLGYCGLAGNPNE